MSAKDDFPRGITLSYNGANTASVTFPATPGVSWVLTDIDFTQNLGSGFQNIISTSLAAGPVGMVAGSGFAQWSWSGKSAGVPGSALTVNGQFQGASAEQTLSVTAYPN